MKTKNIESKFVVFLLTIWPPLGVVLFHAVFTAVFGHQRWLDPLLHFVGGAAVLYSCYRFLQTFSCNTTYLSQFKSFISLLLLVAILLLWELGEFLSDTYLGTHVQRGIGDTGSDILLGLAGATVAFLAIQRKRRGN